MIAFMKYLMAMSDKLDLCLCIMQSKNNSMVNYLQSTADAIFLYQFFSMVSLKVGKHEVSKNFPSALYQMWAWHSRTSSPQRVQGGIRNEEEIIKGAAKTNFNFQTGIKWTSTIRYSNEPLRLALGSIISIWDTSEDPLSCRLREKERMEAPS